MYRIYLAVSLVCAALCAPAQGIQFDTSFASWEEAAQKARQTGRPIFMDVYTSWCGPCKWMDAHVFADGKVGAFYNRNFLSLKLDAEKGYGVAFAKAHHIAAYPTYVFLSPEGEVLLTGVGAQPKTTMVPFGQKALDNWKSGVTLAGLRARAADTRDTAFLLSYINRLSATGQPNAVLIEEYLALLPEKDLYSDKTRALVYYGKFDRMPVHSRAFGILQHAYRKYGVKSGELMSPWNTLRNRLLDFVESAGKAKDTAWLSEILQANGRLDSISWIAERERDYFLCRYSAAMGDTAAFRKGAQHFAAHYLAGADTSLLYAADRAGWKGGLRLKFGTAEEKRLGNRQDYQQFLKTYYPETRVLVYEAMELAYHWKRLMGKGESAVAAGWLGRAEALYQRSPVHQNPFLVKQLHDASAQQP